MYGVLKCFDDQPKKLCLWSFRVFAGQHDVHHVYTGGDDVLRTIHA